MTAYVAHGTATTHRIKASFGDFGAISVRFRPSGRVIKSRKGRGCRGPDRYTSRPGVFAVGDVRGGNIKRVASAVGEGSISIAFVHQLLSA